MVEAAESYPMQGPDGMEPYLLDAAVAELGYSMEHAVRSTSKQGART